MTSQERGDLMYALGQNYLLEKANNEVCLRENAESYAGAKGKLIGACMALGLGFEETINSLTIFTISKKKIVAKVKIED